MPQILGGTIIEGSEAAEISGTGVPGNGTDETQTVTVTATGGTFRVGYEGFYTTALAYGATSATVQTAMRLLPSVNGANVSVAGDAPHTVTFIAGLGKLDVALLTTDPSLLTTADPAVAGTAVVAQGTPGVSATVRGAPIGTHYTNISTGVDYVNTGTALAPTWTTVSDTLGTSYLGSVTPGTVSASKAVVVDSAKVVNEWNVTGTLTVVGAITATTGDVSVAKTDTSATPATERLVRSELTLTPATTLAVGSSGSLAGVRGCVTLTTGKSITDGFLFGAQGKVVLDGATVAVGTGHVAGLYAQLSGAGATITSGHVAILAVSGQSLPASANVNGIYLESGGNAINAAIQFNVHANFLFDINNFESAGIVAAAGSGGTGSAGYAAGAGIPTRVLKVQVDGATAYIPLYSTNA